jgi:Hg(II)-responsive transcriptional regulator
MDGDSMTIGEVATGAGVNVQTLRYYERRGILAPPQRTASGYRKYPSETVRLIRFIKRAQDLGFTLEEVEELLALRRHRNRQKARSMAASKLQSIDAKLRDLQRMKGALETLVDACSCTGNAVHCPILEALDGEENGDARN